MSFLGAAFGRVIKMRRGELGLSQADFAKSMEVEPPTASRWETGASLPVNERIDLILEALQISANDFLSLMAQEQASMKVSEILRDLKSIPILVAYEKLLSDNPKKARDVRQLLGLETFEYPELDQPIGRAHRKT